MTRLALTFELILAHPLFGLALTVAVYCFANQIYIANGCPAVLHPVLTSVIVVALIVFASGIGYGRYFAQAAPLHHALGLLVVLLAVPLARQSAVIRAARFPLAAALIIGSLTALATAIALPVFLHAPLELTASLAPRSATAAVAVGIAERIGGLPGLTAVIVITTGIFGAVAGPGLLSRAGVQDERAMGFALGLTSHAIGTARAFQVSDRAGAFASVGMILNALFTVGLAPSALALIDR